MNHELENLEFYLKPPKDKSQNLLKRKAFPYRFDLIPYTALKEIASVLHYGNEVYPNDTWKHESIENEDSGINHGIGHAIKATAEQIGTQERIRQMTKAAVNLLFQIAREVEIRDDARLNQRNI